MPARRLFVVGTGSVGEVFVRDAAARGHRVTALEAEPLKAERLSHVSGVQAIHLREISLAELRDAGIPRADLVLATADDDAQNMATITYCLELGAPRVGSLASDDEHRDIFQRLGADTVVIPSRLVSERLCGLFLSPSVAYDVILHDGSRVVQVLVRKESPLCGRAPSSVAVPEEGHWVIDVIRNEHHHQPSAVAALEPGDLVAILFTQPAENAMLAGLLH